MYSQSLNTQSQNSYIVRSVDPDAKSVFGDAHEASFRKKLLIFFSVVFFIATLVAAFLTFGMALPFSVPIAVVFLIFFGVDTLVFLVKRTQNDDLPKPYLYLHYCLTILRQFGFLILGGLLFANLMTTTLASIEATLYAVLVFFNLLAIDLVIVNTKSNTRKTIIILMFILAALFCYSAMKSPGGLLKLVGQVKVKWLLELTMDPTVKFSNVNNDYWQKMPAFNSGDNAIDASFGYKYFVLAYVNSGDTVVLSDANAMTLGEGVANKIGREIAEVSITFNRPLVKGETLYLKFYKKKGDALSEYVSLNGDTVSIPVQVLDK